jgi:hypothetical protein
VSVPYCRNKQPKTKPATNHILDFSSALPSYHQYNPIYKIFIKKGCCHVRRLADRLTTST